jgi:hypothetical protein
LYIKYAWTGTTVFGRPSVLDKRIDMIKIEKPPEVVNVKKPVKELKKDPAEAVACNWNVQADGDGIYAVNYETSRVFKGSREEFRKFFE